MAAVRSAGYQLLINGNRLVLIWIINRKERYQGRNCKNCLDDAVFAVEVQSKNDFNDYITFCFIYIC
jgi:hypothetical protein